MKQFTHRFTTHTERRGLYNINREITDWAQNQGLNTGLLTVFVQHTSASLMIQENADPDVLTDLNAFFERIIPDGDPLYLHSAEGPDDMPAHIRSALTQTQLSIPLTDGKLGLGTWQDIYLFEHRTFPHTRSILLHLFGD
ncbi:MAG: YjbQ family protein [Candidatus Nitronauta litoralis]|uniref:YjbQ family protein n=1 Tax=Candidatus Nitronauta litoralis TaxID=2705533 RepID=A0A7T0BVE4_9BACT|nr:MAG: YjbQ family protein [Candidatus Nitronauta litoralis]